MALKIGDRIRETTTTSGTSDFALGGATTGFAAFSTVLSNSDTTYYVCVDGSDFEIGVGTYVSGTNTLQRTTVLQSTNSDAKVNFSSNSKDVFISYPADKAVYLDGSDDITGAAGQINISDFNNDSGYTTNVGDITGVTAGTGISGGGASGTVTVNLDIDGLTAETSFEGTDTIAVYDTSAGALRKGTVANVALQGPTGDKGQKGEVGIVTGKHLLRCLF